MRPERVDEGFRRKARRLNCLLGVHAEHKHVEYHLKICLPLIIATWTPYCCQWPAVFADKIANQSGARAFARRQRVRMPFLEREHLAPRTERAAELGTENRFAEDAAARCERDYVAITIDARDVGGAVLCMSR